MCDVSNYGNIPELDKSRAATKVHGSHFFLYTPSLILLPLKNGFVENCRFSTARLELK